MDLPENEENASQRDERTAIHPENSAPNERIEPENSPANDESIQQENSPPNNEVIVPDNSSQNNERIEPENSPANDESIQQENASPNNERIEPENWQNIVNVAEGIGLVLANDVPVVLQVNVEDEPNELLGLDNNDFDDNDGGLLVEVPEELELDMDTEDDFENSSSNYEEDEDGTFSVSGQNIRSALLDVISQNESPEYLQRLRRAMFSLHNRHFGLRNRGSNAADDEDDAAGGDDGAEDTTNNDEADEEIMENPETDLTANSIRFDTNLPAEHSYLGANMNRVSGVNYLDVGQQYNMMLFMHQHILFPGEVLPFMISGSIMDADIDADNGLLFGVCFPDGTLGEELLYGVTCQIYEKGTDERGNTLIKSRALQRFVTKGSELTGPLQNIATHPYLKCYGFIKILPDIYLREPLDCIQMGSLNRFRDNSSMHAQYRRFQAATTPWPVHIYDHYSIKSIVEKARKQLAQHKIDTMPTDPIQLSYWLVRNLHLSESMMRTIFITDSVNTRMKLMATTFKKESIFTCRYCGNRIANCRELFAMSKHGVQTQYCNSSGYIHETNTVYQLLRNAISFSGEASAEFSWFPGYQWHIIICKICSRHIGWEFKALEPNLVPKSFFGISSSSVRISTPMRTPANPRNVIFRNLIRLARRQRI